jgi:hypothetical protein
MANNRGIKRCGREDLFIGHVVTMVAAVEMSAIVQVVRLSLKSAQEGPQTGYEYRLGPTSDYLQAHAAAMGSLNRDRNPCSSADGEYRECSPLGSYR